MFEDAPQTQELAMGFSQYLRYVLRKQSKNELVDLRLELENVEHYLKIFKVRFDNRFDYRIMASPGTEEIKVPFMILQPLVENAIVHGVEPSLEHCDIFIETELINSSLEIIVRDTGEGFESDRIEEGVGMKNIRERLTLHYGYEASVQVNSSRGQGTSVVLSIPMKERKAS
jgi:LytS/YehU family sensor histidine kinase